MLLKQKIKEGLKNVLDQMGLKLSEEKTKVTHITEGFNFLGYRIERSIGTAGVMVPKVLIPESAMKKYRHKSDLMMVQQMTLSMRASASTDGQESWWNLMRSILKNWLIIIKEGTIFISKNWA